MSTDTTNPAPAPEERGLAPLAGGNLSPLESRGQLWTNLDLSTEDGKAALLEAKSAGEKPADWARAMPFPLTALLLHTYERVDPETGEVQTNVRQVLIGTDGRYLTFGAASIQGGLALLCAAYGPGPWDPPLPIVIDQVRNRHGGVCFNLKIDRQARSASLVAHAKKKGNKNG